jgi:hypothetical protein
MTFKASRRQLTEKETAWLKKHYKHTTNGEIMARLGIKHSHLHDIAKELGLKKTRQFMRKMQANCTEQARLANERIKKEDTERWKEIIEIKRKNLNPGRGFRKGESNKDRLSRKKYERCMAKMAETMRRKRDRDRARVSLGLEPLTRLSLGIPSKRRHALYMAKYHLSRSYGYERGEGLTMYVTEDTRRTTTEYIYIRRYGMKFVVKGEDNPTARAVRLPPDWSDKQGGIASY